MMLALALVLLSSAAPPKVQLVERATLGLSAQQGMEARRGLVSTLAAQGLAAELVPGTCADRGCLVAKSLKADRCVIGVTLTRSRKGLTVDLEAVDGELLVQQETFITAADALARAPELVAFAQKLARKLAPQDAPLAEPEPKRLAAPEVGVQETPEWVESRPSRAPAVLGGLSAGVGAVAVGLLVASAVVKGQLDAALGEQPVITSITRAEAQQRADTANTLLVTGVAGLVLGLGGGATALGLGLSDGTTGP